MGDGSKAPGEHWEAVYRANTPRGVSWYAPHLQTSVSLILSHPRGKDARVIDVGGGASTLVDDLLDAGVRRVTVLDIANQALEYSRARLGAKAAHVTWIAADITQTALPEQTYDVWHDRAVFHFLTNAEDRRRYLAAMRTALKPGGQAILATFALDGPPRCSGLEVVRYSPEALQQELGRGFQLMDTLNEAHQTPFHTTQQFMYGRFLRVPDPA